MNRFFSCLLAGLLVVSCSSEQNEILTDQGSVMQTDDMDTCLCNELAIDSAGIHTKKNELYTGICFENYPNSDKKYIEKSLLKGKPHGKIVYYDQQGAVLFEEIYKEGEKKRSGELEVIECDCSELELVESSLPGVSDRYFLDEMPFTGSCSKYYPESDQIYMDVNYTAGELNGATTYYNKDGSVMYIEKYSMGELMRTVHQK